MLCVVMQANVGRCVVCMMGVVYDLQDEMYWIWCCRNVLCGVVCVMDWIW